MIDNIPLIIKNKLYFLETIYLENIIVFNILEDDKFVRLKIFTIDFDKILTFFTYKNKIFYITLKSFLIKALKRFRIKIYSLDLETFNISLEHTLIFKEPYINMQNYFIRRNSPFTLTYLDVEKWKLKKIKLPFRIKIEQPFVAMLVSDDYVIINGEDSKYSIERNSILKSKLIIKKLDLDIELYDKVFYKNYILFKKNNYVHIFDIKLNQSHKIYYINESTVLCYNNKLLYFHYNDYIENIDIKFYDLPISNLFEKCIYWVDEEKLPEIIKKKVIEYRKNNLILI